MMFNRVSLNTIGLNRIGLNRIGKPSRASSDRPYIDPEVLSSLKAVCICYGKSNDDPDRAVVKNLVDPDNPFVISNAAYTEGSGYADKGSPYYGAFVTDGIDDLITSTKTVQEMGITDEVTVVSMIHQIDLNSTYTIATTNYIENSNSREHVRSDVYNYGKTGIYGYSASLINNTKSDIKNILGDEADYYVKSTNSLQTIFDAKFSVVGRISELTEASQVAWYWTIIANKVLTTDQINQVIAYFNLDRTLNPDILCDVKKQGITNENHAEFGDKLIDFSGNGRDIQLNNLAWKGDSGIGKYNFSNINIIASNKFEGAVTTNKCHFTKKLTNTTNNFCDLIVISPNEPIKFKVSGLSDGRKLFVANKSGSGSNYNFDNGEHEVSLSFSEGVGQNNPFGVTGDIGDIDVTVEFIPSHAGALCLDGVNDFGKVTGMPVYKDYTVVADYERLKINIGVDSDSPILSKSESVNLGAFMFNTISSNGDKVSYSFGRRNIINADDTIRKIFYQSKYINDGQDINIESTFVDSDKLWLGTYRDSDYRFIAAAIYSLMSFPYSMSEFLIERQLKKHKLGTLYPDMVEFRPVIKANNDYEIVYTAIIKPDNWQEISIGDYVTVGKSVAIQIKLNLPLEVTNVSSNSLADVSFYKEETGDNVYTIYGRVLDGKSPQKITIDIQVDSSLVQLNPVVESNAEYKVVDYYIDTLPAVVGNYYQINSKLRVAITTKGAVDEVTQVTVGGVPLELKSSIGDRFTFDGILSNISPQKINITIDEYIRYEDIVQPYPSLFTLIDYDTEDVYSWGSKLKVGARFKGNVVNLLPNMYEWQGNVLYNGEVLDWGIKPGVVAKEMVFSWNMPFKYLIDNNEPKVILSPRLLRIPNSSYKILGYIPDISGHGNHGKINNSAYAEGSGVNEDGSYQFDGVDDFVTIPTIVGGKQVLMKMNWQNRTGLLYDQRKNGSSIDAFAILNVNSNNSIAYNSRNTDGETYIDGILNKNIVCPQLYKITHSITIINQLANKEEVISPTIGSDTTHKIYFSQMSLYDFMLFDDISTEDKIKELNEYVGIEGNTDDLFNETN